MLEGLCGWIQKITGFMMIISMVLAVVPGKEYKKYIHFFAGMMFLLMCCSPILKMLGMEESLQSLLNNAEYETLQDEIQQKEKEFTEMDLTQFLPEKMEEKQLTESQNEIKVEEIKVE